MDEEVASTSTKYLHVQYPSQSVLICTKYSTWSQNDEFALTITHSPLKNYESLKNPKVSGTTVPHNTILDSHFGVTLCLQPVA